MINYPNKLNSCLESGSGVILNAYPDSIGGNLSELVRFLTESKIHDCFRGVYLLPSLFHSDLDRGFSVIDYQLDEKVASQDDLNAIKAMGISLKLDFVLNHASVQSKPFQDLLEKGDKSIYRDFFVDWNRFWIGHGEISPEGFIVPDPETIQEMFFRKPGLPILMVRFPNGQEVAYWNTFYQEIRYPEITPDSIVNFGIEINEAEILAHEINQSVKNHVPVSSINFGNLSLLKDAVLDWLESQRQYLGQMDLNVKSPQVWSFYEETLRTLADYGAKIVRLDAFAYLSKEVGRANFLNSPETWEILKRLKQMAGQLGLELLPEIHASYQTKIYEEIGLKGYLTYDFFLPGLIIDALEQQNVTYLVAWMRELKETGIHTINMLGCHDGIPLLDLKGLLPDHRIESLIETIVGRGGKVKDLHGSKNLYYQVNATYYSALGENVDKLLMARALQLFTPGMAQVWYLDLFEGKNDTLAIERAGSGGHKEINRTNLTSEEVQNCLKSDTVIKQLELIHFRNTCDAFGYDAKMHVETPSLNQIIIKWEHQQTVAVLEADLTDLRFRIEARGSNGVLFVFSHNSV